MADPKAKLFSGYQWKGWYKAFFTKVMIKWEYGKLWGDIPS